MGSYGARISLPPYAEPIRPYGDPLMWREIAWYGAQMAYKETENGYTGAINNAIYSGWGHFGFHWITPFHNIDGMLTESASAKLATPLYILPSSCRAARATCPSMKKRPSSPTPGRAAGGICATSSTCRRPPPGPRMDIAARNRETVLWNAYQKAGNQTERGAEAPLKRVRHPRQPSTTPSPPTSS
jgi:hypothetical protein